MNIVLTELYPLNRGKPARARKRDSNTSHDAAARAEADTRTHWQRQSIRAAVSRLGGATAREISKITGIGYIQCQRRLSEVPGLYKTDDERDGCKVWRAV
jgi:hypothetical protein